VVRGVSRAAAEFVDKHGYVSAALQGTTTRLSEALPEAEWTTKGVLLGLLTVLLAVGVAAVALWAPKIPDLAKKAAAPLHPVVTGLRRVHSGHIGDYVAWLFVGVAAFTALVGIPLI
jgi:multicomponent Na+:H+ antiporter subunit D